MKSKQWMKELLEAAMLSALPDEPASTCDNPAFNRLAPPAPVADDPAEEAGGEGAPAPGASTGELPSGASAEAAGADGRKRKKKPRKDHGGIRPVDNGRAPVCRHFGVCGGCEYQHVPYARQTAAKVNAFRALAARHNLTDYLPLTDLHITGSPQEFGYRQRMDYVFAFGKAGLRERGSHKFVVELEECPLLGERGFAAYKRAVELARAGGLEPYNYLRNEGYLRYLVVRRARESSGGAVMLSLVTKSREHETEVGQIAQTLLAEGLTQSVHWLLQDTLSDVSFGDPLRHWGAEHITEIYAGKTFRIGPNTFFQANPAVAEEAYLRIAAFAAEVRALTGGDMLAVDAYSGTGVIAQLIAAGCGHVAAVENVPDNVAIARENLRCNQVPNVTLHEEDAGAFLAAATERPDLLVVNPPRTGLGPKAVRALRKVGAPYLAYMSCNPATLMEDLGGLLGLTDEPATPEGADAPLLPLDVHKPARPKDKEAPGAFYRVSSTQLYDMFPQTRHWETLVLLQRAPEPSENKA